MKLEDQFDVIKKLGQGAYGLVLHVRDKNSKKEFAAKVLARPDSDRARHLFYREVRQLERYRGLRGVIRLVNDYLTAEPPFFVMPLAGGGSLAEWAGKLSQPQLLTVICRLIETLGAMHADGGFHRDVKPDNLLLLGDGSVVLADFGVGNSPHVTVVMTNGPQGTEGFAAPELDFDVGGEFTPAADVFSAGATWYNLITGERPTRKTVLPMDPRRVRRDTPAWIAELVMKMTAPRPEERPTTAEILVAIRVQFPDAEEVALPREKPQKPPRREVGVPDWLKAVGLVALIVIGAVLLFFGGAAWAMGRVAKRK